MESKNGQIVTFYSYRGGSGRSMALANTACLLAQSGKKVLVVDFDWQSPGQHVIFAPHVAKYFASIGSKDPSKDLNEHLGLVDLLSQLHRHARVMVRATEPGKEELDRTLEFVQHSHIDHCIIPTDIEGLSLLKCGSMGGFYNAAMTFDWQQVWTDCSWLMFAFAERLRHEYDYVLIDSTAGLGDTATICTAVLPSQIVYVVSPGEQRALKDGIAMLRQAANYRRESSDLRPLQIFPLPCLTDNRESDLRSRFFKELEGAFSAFFCETYALPSCSLQPYLYESEIPYFPWASYGEDLAVLKPSVNSVNSLEAAYRRFHEHFTSGRLPWEKKT
jgi:Mrp family chromosome partitioning ATPase